MFEYLKISEGRVATLGSLIGAGAVAIPIGVYFLTLGLLLPSDASLMAKVFAPILGALAMFLFGFLYFVPVGVVLGGITHRFLKSVQLKSFPAYLISGPVLGLCNGMVTHLLAPDIIDEILGDAFGSYIYVGAHVLAGTILTVVFWIIRRPDRPWDDVADRLRAGDLA